MHSPVATGGSRWASHAPFQPRPPHKRRSHTRLMTKKGVLFIRPRPHYPGHTPTIKRSHSPTPCPKKVWPHPANHQATPTQLTPPLHLKPRPLWPRPCQAQRFPDARRGQDPRSHPIGAGGNPAPSPATPPQLRAPPTTLCPSPRACGSCRGCRTPPTPEGLARLE